MKSALTFSIFISIICASCVSKQGSNGVGKTKSVPIADSNVDNKLSKADSMYIVGDFDGDRKRDTIFKYLYSNREHTYIDSVPSGDYVNWDSLLDWFHHEEVNVILKINKPGFDSLNLGEGLGLFFFQNIGDNNKDGKDEFALVFDVLDYSSINSCNIYTLCKGKWKELEGFTINENSFQYDSSISDTVFTSIDGYFERKAGRWYYLDYFKEFNDESKLQPLILPKCK